MLSVRDLRKVFKGFAAVDGVSFDVAAGGSLAIVGESGSGKTTCARIVAGLDRPTSGTVTLDGGSAGSGVVALDRGSAGSGVVALKGSSARSRLGRARIVQMVFQDPYQSLDRRQTVESCLAEVLALHGVRDKSRIGELLELVGLDGRHAKALPRDLSGGQRQRVAIARALAPNPRLLVLDEAVAALDVSIQAQILNLLADTRKATGVGFLFITHDLSVVRHVCDDVIVMRHGRIVEEGPVEQVLTEPRHDYTRRLVGSIPRPGWRPTRAAARDA